MRFLPPQGVMRVRDRETRSRCPGCSGWQLLWSAGLLRPEPVQGAWGSGLSRPRRWLSGQSSMEHGSG